MRWWFGAVLLVAVVTVPLGPVRAGEVVDMLGRRIAVPAQPARVVSLAPSLTETVFALGAEARLVGVSDSCDYPAEARRKPRVGGIYTPSFEAILALRPDLLLATSEGNRLEHVRGLENLGLAVYVVRPVDFVSTLESIARVGALLGREGEAAVLVAAMRRRADQLARAVAGTPRPRVLYVLWGGPLIVPGRETLITDLITRAGGESVTAAEPIPYPRLSLEAAVERRPDQVILARHGTASVAEQLRAWEPLAAIQAVREGRVQGVDGDLLHRPGPRIVEGLRALARILHPDRVP
jgi:iron complex transport system substrate-binding protein